MIFLHAHGVGTARAVRIFRTYGTDAVAVMTEDPYRLARDVRGIGFRTADAIAARLGLPPTAPARLRAGIAYALEAAMDDGHCALPVADLVTRAAGLLDVEAGLIAPPWSRNCPARRFWPTRSGPSRTSSCAACTGPSAPSPSG